MDTGCIDENVLPELASPETSSKRSSRRRRLQQANTTTQDPASHHFHEPSTSDAFIDQAAEILNKRKTVLNKARKKGNVTILPRTCNAHSVESSWEEIDRQRLLIALQRFGILNMKELLKAVPGKSEEEIKTFIQAKWRSARLHLREELKKNKKKASLGPIDKWLEILNEKFPSLDVYKANPLARAVLFIWKFEKHPDPKECGGVDFRAAYEYLYYMLRGFPPRELNQPTAKFVSESLSNFAFLIKHQPWVEEKHFIKNGPLRIKNPPRETKTDEDVVSALSFTDKQCLEELVKLPGFNPFNVPLHYLIRNGPASSTVDLPTTSSSSKTVNEDISADSNG